MFARSLLAASLTIAMGASAHAEKEDLSYNALVGRGFELAGTFLMPVEVAKEYNKEATGAYVIVHLRKGSAVGLCYFGLAAWINGDQSALNHAKACDMRTAPGYNDAEFDFLAPVTTRSIAGWRVNRQTGAVGYCYFSRQKEGTVGEMTCPKPGENAGEQKEPGPFALVQTLREGEPSIMRVNQRTGALSLCYPWSVNDRVDRVVCTEPAR